MKLLMESRRFEYIEMKCLAFKKWSGILIETDELEVHQVPLEKILKSEFFKIKSLRTKYSNENFNSSLFDATIR